MKSINLNSLSVKLNFMIITIITIAIVIQSLYYILNIKASYENNLQQQSKINLIELKDSITHYIDAYEVTEYEKLLKTNIQHNKYIKAIVLNDFNIGKILGESSYNSGYVNVSNEIISINDERMKRINFFEKSRNYISTDLFIKNEKVGFLKMYISESYVSDRIKNYTINNLIFVIIIYFLLVLISVNLIKRFFTRPLDNVINSIENNSSNVESIKKLDEKSSYEFEVLSQKFNEMTQRVLEHQDTLKKSKLTWEFALEGTGDGLWDWDIISNKVYFSKQWKKMIGYEENELSDKFDTWKNLIHNDDIDYVIAEVDNFIRGRIDTLAVEHRLRCKDGSYKWILSRGIIIERDELGSPSRLTGTHSDISKIKEYELGIKETAVVFDNTSDGILLTDKNKEIINVNKVFEDMSGYKKEELLGKNPKILKSQYHDQKYYENMWASINGNGSWSGNLLNINADGTASELITTINSISFNDKIEYYVAVYHDVTLQKKQEQIISQQSKTAALGEMIGNISHQWRQPLSIISTASTGLKFMIEYNDDIDKKELINQLEQINTTTQYLSNTIEDFRNFFKVDSIEKTNFLVSKTINKAIKLVKANLDKNFITVIENIEDKTIYSYENLLLQVLINIINNATDALKEIEIKEKFIFIDVCTKDNKLLISIKDNGGGISKEIIDRIFEPYFTTKHESVGTGLGLYMSFEIITKQLDGNIFAENLTFKHDDKTYDGACFNIELNYN